MSNLDTRNKRGSALGIDFNWLHVYPNPDGAITQLDRQQIAYKYSGITSSSFIPSPVIIVDWLVRARRQNKR